MADRSIKLRDLKSILARYGVSWSASRGKGSHILFEKDFPEGKFSYPVPTHEKDVKICYVQGCRKKFRLQVKDGVSDDDFYNG